MKEFINIAIKGAIVGVANIIPGVSGGTMAFVLGIYSRITESISYFLIRPEKRKEYFLFLCNLFVGVVLGFLIFAKLIIFLLGTNLPEGSPLPVTYVPTFGFFLGLILGSIPVLIKLQSDTKFSPKRLALLILGATSLFALAQLRGSESVVNENSQLIKDFGLFHISSISSSRGIWLFVVGFLAAFTMVVPGVSGSALLIALGEYAAILNYISDRSIVPIAMIGMGVVCGLLAATFIITKLLKHFPGATFYFILGLVLASCIQVFLSMLMAQVGLVIWVVALLVTVLGYFVGLNSEKLQS